MVRYDDVAGSDDAVSCDVVRDDGMARYDVMW